jgi:hypothetical protein
MKPIKLTDEQLDAAIGLSDGQRENIAEVTGFTDDELATAYSVPVECVRALRTDIMRALMKSETPWRARLLTHAEKTLLGALK